MRNIQGLKKKQTEGDRNAKHYKIGAKNSDVCSLLSPNIRNDRPTREAIATVDRYRVF